jgi:hypothetical protein
MATGLSSARRRTNSWSRLICSGSSGGGKRGLGRARRARRRTGRLPSQSLPSRRRTGSLHHQARAGRCAARQLAINLVVHAGAQWFFDRIQKLPGQRGHDLISFAIRLLGRCLAKKGMLPGRELGNSESMMALPRSMAANSAAAARRWVKSTTRSLTDNGGVTVALGERLFERVREIVMRLRLAFRAAVLAR